MRQAFLNLSRKNLLQLNCNELVFPSVSIRHTVFFLSRECEQNLCITQANQMEKSAILGDSVEQLHLEREYTGMVFFSGPSLNWV